MSHGEGPHERQAIGATPTMHTAACEMETGRLDVSWIDSIDVAPGPEPIFAFAERDNPRRAFLFVSRVLGRHVPVSPAVMRRAFAALADDIPADLPGPVLMTGMAETAVGLGAGVHDAYLARTGRDDVVYLSSTRARFAGPLLADFSETHSHASAHRLHVPQHARERALVGGARSLVMVDDEASSGATFRHLADALAIAGLDGLERVHTAVLTDWSEGAEGAGAASGGTPTTARSALTRGRHRWTPRADAPRRTLPDEDTARVPSVDPLPRADDGRLGRAWRSTRTCPPELAASLVSRPVPSPVPNLESSPATAVPDDDGASTRASGATVLVLGTGEHVWEPFLVAEALERDGHAVRFGATTRSPIRPGHAIGRGYAFADHEGLGITNYLYNVDPDAYARIVLCVDTALDALDASLIRVLGADVLVDETFHPHASLAERILHAPLPRAFVAPGGWTASRDAR